MDSNIPISHAYGVYVSRLIDFARVCRYLQDVSQLHKGIVQLYFGICEGHWCYLRHNYNYQNYVAWEDDRVITSSNIDAYFNTFQLGSNYVHTHTVIKTSYPVIEQLY